MIKGFIPVSFIDWRGELSSVIFLGGCNFRCPFCHNRDLVLEWKRMPDIPFEAILSHLRKHKRWVDKVVITGGEATIHKGLSEMLRILKGENFFIKLDTNGSMPAVIKSLLDNHLVDYIAMDIKGPIQQYKRFCKVNIRENTIKESVLLLTQSNVNFEFRMTVVPFLHKEEEVSEVAKFLKNKGPFFLQNFRPVNTLDPSFSSIRPFSEEQFEKIVRKVQEVLQ